MPEHPYLRLKNDLKDEIAAGVYGPNDRLPSQRQLGQRYGLSHMTVRRAINELVREGVIYARQGQGLYVADTKQEAERGPLVSFTEDMALRGMRASSRVLEKRIVNATTMLASTLQVVVGQPLVCLRRLRLADNEPMAIQTAYLPSALCPGLLQLDLEDASLYELLRSKYGLRIADSQSAAGADITTEEEARLLGVTHPAPLLVTEQITYLDTGAPIEFVRSLYRGDRYQLQVARRQRGQPREA
ncbi:MAG TPA: GntR family transcriptional regulator [Trueperaceae bacterium]